MYFICLANKLLYHFSKGVRSGRGAADSEMAVLVFWSGNTDGARWTWFFQPQFIRVVHMVIQTMT